jgi:hypothetical protein|nr:MAG TPA: hypothetical protein [Caudoviricetes sp.]
MKKNLATILLAVTVLTGATIYVATPVQPERYELHTVQYGETFEGIIKDANKDSDVNYDIREAVTKAVTESSKIEGGATSRQLNIGDKVAVPIYR